MTLGVLDALSAAAAGLRGVALLGASLPDPSHPSASSNALVDGLTDIDGRLVLALDADEAGQRGADRLQGLLAERRPDIVRITPPTHVDDLNDWMLRAGDDWPAQLTREVRLAIDCMKARSLAR